VFTEEDEKLVRELIANSMDSTQCHYQNCRREDGGLGAMVKLLDGVFQHTWITIIVSLGATASIIPQRLIISLIVRLRKVIVSQFIDHCKCVHDYVLYLFF
jgi:hypothetical protein